MADLQCPECDGTGMTPTGGYTWNGQRYYSDPPCQRCGGTGRIHVPDSFEESVRAGLRDASAGRLHSFRDVFGENL